MKAPILVSIFFTLFLAFNAGFSQAIVNHSPWDRLLQENVDSQGNVNYEGFKQSSSELDIYLESLAASIPKNSWSKNERLSYWINSYNAFTIKLILMNYPVKSIMDINNGKAWDLKFIELEGKNYSLNQIENEIIRPNFNEPRIHFAVNCAAKSCPKLNNRAFLPSVLNKQLDKMTKEFINNSQKNRINSSSISISKIFDWYKSDFEKNGGLINFLNNYSVVKIQSDAAISYQKYNWELNN